MDMNINININDADSISIDNVRFKKMLFIYNALEDGWAVKKSNDSLIFSKNHEGKKEIFLEEYLARFLKSNFDLSKILN